MKLISKSIELILIMVFFVGFAQSDQKSIQILESATQKYKQNQNNYFKFLYSIGLNEKIQKKQTGIFYSTASSFKLKIMGLEQIFDGKKVYSINDEDMEVTISKANGKENILSPLSYLNSYKNDYTSQFIGNKRIGGKNCSEIKLTPKKNNGLKFAMIYIDTNNKNIQKIIQQSKNNETTSIEIQDYKNNQTLSTDFFQFNQNKYKNYIITEL